MRLQVRSGWRSLLGPKSSPRFAARPHSARRRLLFEPLEDRQLLAITVNTLVDEADGSIVDGDISLRDAIALAPAGETIDFSVTGTISLSNLGSSSPGLGSLVVDKELTIDGPGADLLTIKGYDPTPASKTGDGRRIFRITAPGSVSVSIRDIAITGADSSVRGGAIYNSENLSVVNCVITGNSAGADDGGGIFSNGGTLDVRNCAITGNRAGDAGGISSFDPMTISGSTISNNLGNGIESTNTIVISSSTISGNSVTGIFQFSGSLTVNDCIVSNHTTNYGSGILSAGSATIVGSVVSGNAGAGISAQTLTVVGCTVTSNARGVSGSNLTISASKISGNSEGGVFCNPQTGFLSTVTGCTISNNTAYSGGGIFCSRSGGGTLAVLNTTISGNSATLRGGGIIAYGDMIIESSTISGNSSALGGGGVLQKFGTLQIRHSTITNNTAANGNGSGMAVHGNSTDNQTSVYACIVAGNMNSDVDTFDGTFNNFESQGYNLIGTGNTIGEFVEAGDQIGVDPMLASLADNGGPTLPDGSKILTHALLPGSPAIDAGDPTAEPGVNGVPEFDQRGNPYTRVFDGDSSEGIALDIGSFETQTLPAAFYGDYNLDGFVDSADYTLWRDSLGAEVAEFSGADGDGDGVVDDDDYHVWRSHFGESVPPAGGGAAALSIVSRAIDAAESTSTSTNEPAIHPPLSTLQTRITVVPARGTGAQVRVGHPMDQELLLVATNGTRRLEAAAVARFDAAEQCEVSDIHVRDSFFELLGNLPAGLR